MRALPVSAVVVLLASACSDDVAGGGSGADVAADTVESVDAVDSGLEDIVFADVTFDVADSHNDTSDDVTDSDPVDARDAGDGDGGPPPVPVRVSGRVVFMRTLHEVPRAAAGFEVTVDGASAGTTDGDGQFEVEAYAGAVLGVRALIAGSVVVQNASGTRVHSAPLGVAEGSGTAVLDESVLMGAVAAPFNIATVADAGLDWMEEIGGRPAAPVRFRWEAGDPWPCGSCFTGSAILLGGSTEDPDEWDDAIIVHELGHFVVASVSADSSSGGTHRDRRVAPTLAWAEGLAYFFAAAVLGDALLIDTYESSDRRMDLERMEVDGVVPPGLPGTSTGDLTGEMREELVSAVLFDAADAVDAAEGDDLALGFGYVFALTLDWDVGLSALDSGAVGIDLSDWLVAAFCDGVDGGALERLVARHGASWNAPAAEVCRGEGSGG